MTLGLIGDVHGEDAALEAALAFLRSQQLDLLLCTGDLPAKQGVGDTARCCILLREAGVKTIRGNHDRWQVENAADPFLAAMGEDWLLPEDTLAFLQALPATRLLETPWGKLLLCHGIGKDDMAELYPGGSDAPIAAVLTEAGIAGRVAFMVAGHTHRRMVRHVAGVTILNPGTLRWEEEPGFAILDLAGGFIQFYDLTPFTNAIASGVRIALEKAT